MGPDKLANDVCCIYLPMSVKMITLGMVALKAAKAMALHERCHDPTLTFLCLDKFPGFSVLTASCGQGHNDKHNCATMAKVQVVPHGLQL